MKCPNCGKPAGVIDTRLIEEGTVRMRRRKCHPERGGCGTKFNSIERYLDVVRGPLFAGVKSRGQTLPRREKTGNAELGTELVDQEAHAGRDARATGLSNGDGAAEGDCSTSHGLPAVSIGNYLGDPQARNWPERRILELQC